MMPSVDDIAVVGIGLRFPGKAADPEQLWKVLIDGESQWSEFPHDRLNIDGYYHPGGDRQGSISFRGAHFLREDIAAFDAPFFSIAAEDAKAIDPQQRLLLEICYEAIENAGITKEGIDGSDTAVYVGSFVKDYEQICLRDPDWQPQYAATGNGIAIMANRISHFFNLHGPSVTVDTGCSGSLVSVHLGAQSLRTGEASLAIVAGAGMILTPNTIMPMTALNFLSPDGKCFTFDSRANGYGRGEGIGVVVLKRLSDALRDNDTIRAVIRGTKVNQDGYTTGITLPSKEAQVANICSVYESAGLDFGQTAYVECHGTGTQAGDWRELKAISESLGSVRDSQNPIIVGSVKPNIGHLEGAAGIAGLIKGVLTLEHGVIPPNINFERGNPDINFHEWKVKVPRAVMDWPLIGLRRVSVNCFGFGGTNAHAILDEAPRYLSARRLKGNHNSAQTNLSWGFSNRFDKNVGQASRVEKYNSEPKLFMYSSHEKSGVHRVINSHIPYMISKIGESEGSFLRDYAYTLNCRRSNLEWRHFVVSTSSSDLVSNLQKVDGTAIRRVSSGKTPKLCFIFAGQGSQYFQMGKHLLCFEPFRLSLEEAATYMRSTLNSPFDMLDEMFKDSMESKISNPEVAQPAVTALQIGLVDLLRAFGVKPTYVIGHSSGEVAAAYACGTLSREHAWEVAYYRGLASSRLPQKALGLKGAMIVVGMSAVKIRDYIKKYAWKAEVACINSPRSVTLSGTSKDIREISNTLSNIHIFNRILSVSTPYHSSYMKLVQGEYNSMLRRITPSKPQHATMFSSVTGGMIDSQIQDAEYWTRNLVSTVQYVAAVETMMNLQPDQRPDIILELSPKSALRSPTSDILSHLQLRSSPKYLSTLDSPELDAKSLLTAIGELWSHGCCVDLSGMVIQAERPKCLVDLPPYPWNHAKSYWHESHLGRANRFREFGRQDLIGAPTADAISFEPRWRGFLRISENPWLQDHKVQKTIVYPAAGMVTMALEGASQLVKDKSDLLGYEIARFQVYKAMIIPSTSHGLETAMNFKRTPRSGDSESQNDCFEFTIYSKQLDKAWEENASGSLQVRYKVGFSGQRFYNHKNLFKDLRRCCTEKLVPRQLYELLDIVGMNYGTLFQNISQISRGNNSSVSTVEVPDTKSKMPAQFEYPHLIHPTTLDAMFQTLFAIDNTPMVPTYIENLFISAHISREVGTQFKGYATANRVGLRDVKADIAMAQSSWEEASVIITGLQLTELSISASENGGFIPNYRNLCTEVTWARDYDHHDPSSLTELLKIMAHKLGGLSILQIGVDDGQFFASSVLDVLRPSQGQAPAILRYTIAKDHDTEDSSELMTRTCDIDMEPYVELRAVDGSEPLAQYDLILVSDVASIDMDLLTSRHLKANGTVLIEGRDEKSTPISHLYQAEAYEKMLEFRYHRRHLVTRNNIERGPNIVFLMHNVQQMLGLTDLARGVMVPILEKYPDATLQFVLMNEVVHKLESISSGFVISLLELHDNNETQRSIFNWDEQEFNAFHALQQAAKCILWVTRGAHMEPSNPRASPIIALARTILSEDPMKSIVTLDLDSRRKAGAGNKNLARTISSVFLTSFEARSGSAPRETNYAEKNGELFIPRLYPIGSLNRLVENGDASTVERGSFHDHDGPLELHVSTAGLTKDNLSFIPADQGNLLPTDVEIIFDQALVTASDLDIVMGRSTETEIGLDVVGFVGRVGSKVNGFNQGDRVAAITRDGAFKNRIKAHHRLVKKWSCTMPLSQSTMAFHSLSETARLAPGASVLIHAGASSFGLSAVKIAFELGAEVFATVTGHDSVKQRQALKVCGVKSYQILDANSDSFVEAARELTHGKGVDVIYNPTQAHIEDNFNCIRRGGMIIQFASKSPTPRTVRMPSSNCSYIHFDFPQLLRDDPDYVAELADMTIQLGRTAKLPFILETKLHRNAENLNLKEALRSVEANPLLGFDIVLGGRDTNPLVNIITPLTTRSLPEVVKADQTYLLAGGLGGLGRSICKLLADNGAKHIAFLSRSGSSSKTSAEFVEALEGLGVQVGVYTVDICDKNALQQVVDKVTAEMPPVDGVFQCAAVIKDAVFENMSYADWQTAFRPKTMGTENLFNIISASGHDPFFVFLASSAGVIGNRGQSNYAAGNFYLDALARHLRLEGKHAVSIDLGPVLGAGMLAEDEEILDMLKASGFYGIRHEDFLKMVSHAITMEIVPGVPMPPQVTMGVGTGGLILQNQPADPYWSRTALYRHMDLVDMPKPDLSIVSGSAKVDMKSMLTSCTNNASAAEVICTGLSQMLAKAMNMLPEEIDAGKPPNVYGVDSLVAVGVRNWVQISCGVDVSVFEVLSDKTVAEMAGEIAKRGGYGMEKN